MYCRVPSPSDVRSITDAMPMTMPSVVRTERSRWATTAEPARRSRSGESMAITGAQRRDRIEPRRAPRRHDAEQHADRQRHDDGAGIAQGGGCTGNDG